MMSVLDLKGSQTPQYPESEREGTQEKSEQACCELQQLINSSELIEFLSPWNLPPRTPTAPPFPPGLICFLCVLQEELDLLRSSWLGV